MTAHLIDGKALSEVLRADVGRRAAALAAQGRRPGLAVILVGDDPASAVYVRNKIKACADTGVRSVFEKYDATLAEDALLARIAALNADPSVHGILVQMPLPKHINPHKVIEAAVKKLDTDGVGEGSLKSQPMVEAGVRSTIGNTLVALGRYEEALPVLQRAMELRRAVAPEGSLEIAQSLDLLASAHQYMARHADAVRLYREALEQIGGWLASGQLHYRETVVQGLENFCDAFARLFSGDKLGKLVLAV